MIGEARCWTTNNSCVVTPPPGTRTGGRGDERTPIRTPPDWDPIRPLLDEALDRFDRADRDALLLRFFEQRSLAEVGHALGANEDAARKRVSRALEKLRADLIRRGVTTTAVVLSTAISANAVQIAPAGLAAALTSTSLAGVAAGTGITLTLLKFVAMTRLKLGIVSAIVVAGVATPLVIQHQAQVIQTIPRQLARHWLPGKNH